MSTPQNAQNAADFARFEAIRERYGEVVRGRAGRWLDPGEAADLERRFFAEGVPTLLAMVAWLLDKAATK